RAAVLHRKPGRARTIFRAYDAARFLACALARAAWSVPALDRRESDQLDVRGHPQSDRPRLRIPVPTRLPLGAPAVGGVRAYCHWLLAGLRAVSDAGRDVRLVGH